MDTHDSSAPTPSSTSDGNTLVLRIPRMNLQAALLGLVALITVFQTIQLFRINSKASSAAAKTPTVNTSSESHHGSNTDVPQSMVGGC